MIWACVKRHFHIRLLLQKVEQTLHHNEGSFGRLVKSNAMNLFLAMLLAPFYPMLHLMRVALIAFWKWPVYLRPWAVDRCEKMTKFFEVLFNN